MRVYTARHCKVRDGQAHFAEVTVQAEPSPDRQTVVVLSPTTLDALREAFGDDWDFYRHCVWSAIVYQIDTANVKGDLPHVGRSSFRAEVLGLKVSGCGGRELSGFLLSVAGMEAVGEYLIDWEREQAARSLLAKSHC